LKSALLAARYWLLRSRFDRLRVVALLFLAEPLLHSANASVAVAAHLLQVRGMYGGSSMRACNGLGQ
jgi:hypothetical protein